jgi:flagellar motility protein MotE (MotC chaperone)
MKTIRSFALTLLGAIVVLIGAEVAVIKVAGKEALQKLPLLRDAFTVVQTPAVVEEPKDPRLDEIDAILAKLKEREQEQALRDDQVAQLAAMQADLEQIERRNKALFDRIRQLYPIIDAARQETLLVLAHKYEKMTPEGAAEILDGKTDQECAELLLVMSDRSSAKVLEALASRGTSDVERERSRKRASTISELMRNTLMLSNEKAALFKAP